MKFAVVIASAALACALLVQHWTGFGAHPSGATSVVIAFIVILFSALSRLLLAVLKLWRQGENEPFSVMQAAAPGALREQAIMVAAVALVSLMLFSVTFLKSMITAAVPFWADPPLAAIDRFIGLDPERLALAMAPALPLMGLLYGLWHVADLGGILWVIHWQRPARGRFVLSYMLTWTIGMALAFAFSSAGPLFTGGYDLSIAPQSVQIPARFLWENYRAGGALLGGGISAFPSIHVAIASWFALVLAHRGWPKLGIAYVVAIYVGSIVLGWHYSADGAGGIAVALAADWIARRLTGQDRGRTDAGLRALPSGAVVAAGGPPAADRN